jgi:hypothetical protein
VTQFGDASHLRENERIRLIGEQARTKIVGALIEKRLHTKIARYIRRVTEQFPTVRHVATVEGPTKQTVIVRFGPKTVP